MPRAEIKIRSEYVPEFDNDDQENVFEESDDEEKEKEKDNNLMNID
jgi:hypothetical protein